MFQLNSNRLALAPQSHSFHLGGQPSLSLLCHLSSHGVLLFQLVAYQLILLPHSLSDRCIEVRAVQDTFW